LADEKKNSEKKRKKGREREKEREKYEVINILFYRESIARKKRRAQIVNSRAFSAKRSRWE